MYRVPGLMFREIEDGGPSEAPLESRRVWGGRKASNGQSRHNTKGFLDIFKSIPDDLDGLLDPD